MSLPPACCASKRRVLPPRQRGCGQRGCCGAFFWHLAQRLAAAWAFALVYAGTPRAFEHLHCARRWGSPCSAHNRTRLVLPSTEHPRQSACCRAAGVAPVVRVRRNLCGRSTPMPAFAAGRLLSRALGGRRPGPFAGVWQGSVSLGTWFIEQHLSSLQNAGWAATCRSARGGDGSCWRSSWQA